MSLDDLNLGSDSKGRSPPTGPYVLQALLAGIPLSADGEEIENDSCISCVEYWSGNLYIGTTAGGLLHYVSIPGGGDEGPIWIQASRRSLVSADDAQGATKDVSVQQILLLPKVNKACILCHGSTTFYTLPELTPAFTTTKLLNCTWIGGLDQNEDISAAVPDNGVVIMIFRKTRIIIARVADRITTIRGIDLGGCLAAARRGSIACVADSTAYSLLDVVEQQRIPLFDIVSGSGPEEVEQDPVRPPEETSVEFAQTRIDQSDEGENEAANTQLLPSESMPTSPLPDPRSDNSFPPRNSSLSTATSNSIFRSPAAEEPKQGTSSAIEPRSMDHQPSQQSERKVLAPIRPKIMSPTRNEFLLITGTSAGDPSVGMFVNLDGEVVRGTIEFSSFPMSICLDGDGVDADTGETTDEPPTEGYVLALVRRTQAERQNYTIEIKRWDMDPNEPANRIYWLDINTGLQNSDSIAARLEMQQQAGLRNVIDPLECRLGNAIQLLGLSRLKLPNNSPQDEEQEDMRAPDEARERSETQFIEGFANSKSTVIVWAGNTIWTAVRNPLIARVESELTALTDRIANGFSVDRDAIELVIKEARGQEPRTQLEFLSITYIHQKASLLLYMDLLSRAANGNALYERDSKVTGESLISGELDPRVLLMLVPLLREEIVEGPDGIWSQRGLNAILDEFLLRTKIHEDFRTYGENGHRLLQLVKNYLVHWRERKGYASVTDGKEKSATVDAALIHLMVVLDANSPPGRGHKGSIRAELYTVIRQGVDSFDRIRHLLEEYDRLYVLSLLYQSRKMSRDVLATWKRIIVDGRDSTAELIDGESQMRRYLTQINDAELVKEYATWLARRNPSLAVRVFTDGDSKIKFTPEDTVELLKARAPGAVKVFLEHLVFEKNLAAYATDLIKYYLDAVIVRLESSDAARNVLLSSYQEYRALRTPKPTYSQFAADKDNEEGEWWQNRLRLLQLLGGSHGAASQYDVPGMLAQVRRFEQELVPEMIVLAGKQGQHEEAIHLLVKSLGDYDTAVTYCLLGGSSTYSPTAGSMPKEHVPSREQQEALFEHLLSEFLDIDDLNDRVTQTSELLDRFAGWFDPRTVLGMVPDSWSVDLLSGFLQSSLRNLITEHKDTAIVKALLNVDNLTANADLIEKLVMYRPQIEYSQSELT